MTKPKSKIAQIEKLRDEIIQLENDLKLAGTYTAEVQAALQTVLGVMDKYR